MLTSIRDLLARVWRGASLGLSSQIMEVQAEQVNMRTFFFELVQPVWKNREHRVHSNGFEPEENFFLQDEQCDELRTDLVG